MLNPYVVVAHPYNPLGVQASLCAPDEEPDEFVFEPEESEEEEKDIDAKEGSIEEDSNIEDFESPLITMKHTLLRCLDPSSFVVVHSPPRINTHIRFHSSSSSFQHDDLLRLLFLRIFLEM